MATDRDYERACLLESEDGGIGTFVDICFEADDTDCLTPCIAVDMNGAIELIPLDLLVTEHRKRLIRAATLRQHQHLAQRRVERELLNIRPYHGEFVDEEDNKGTS